MGVKFGLLSVLEEVFLESIECQFCFVLIWRGFLEVCRSDDVNFCLLEIFFWGVGCLSVKFILFLF